MVGSRTSWLALMVGASTMAVTAAHAQQDAAPGGIAEGAGQIDAGEIIVTAQKRSESVQKVPLAITAVGGEELRTRQLTSFESLAPSLPNVNFGKNVGFARIAIRGLGLDSTVGAQEGRVAYHVDGIYIGRPSAQLASFFDISRVEVVRGPQGTLYGRNATAGAINVITNDPQEELSGYARLTAGNYGLFQEEGAIGGSVSHGVSARFAFIKTDRSGYGTNLSTGAELDNEHSLGVRAKLKFDLSSSAKLLLSGDYSYQDDAAYVYHFMGQGNPASPPRAVPLGGRIPANPRNSFANIPQDDQRRNWGVGATGILDLGGATLTSVTGYRRSRADVVGDHDGTQANISKIRTLEDGKQFSEELRLDGETGRLKWLVGAFYFNERIYAESNFSPVLAFSTAFLSRGLHFNGQFKTDAYAAFGQADYELVDGLTASVGVRYSHEKKAVDQRGAIELFTPVSAGLTPLYTSFQDQSATFNSTTPRFNLQWQVSNQVMLYVTYAKGFKSGGYSLGGSSLVQPEKVTDYEGGVKATVLDGALRLNGSVFHYDYKDLQVQRIINNVGVLVNAASAHVNGVEAEFTIRPFRGFELSGNASYLDAEFSRFESEDSARPSLGLINLAGNRLPQAPKYTANLAAQYTQPLESGALRLRGDLFYSSLIYFSFYNRPEISQTGFKKYNMTLSYEGNNGFNASLWIKNIANRRTVSVNQVSSAFQGFPIMGTYDPPRTFGGSIGISF